MQTTLILLIVLLTVLTLGGFTFLISALMNLKNDRSRDEHLLKLQGQIEGLSHTFHERIQETNQSIQKQFSESIGIVKDVTEKLVKLDETNKQIIDYTSQLKKLENILKKPKQRGILGEYFLETLLGNIFAPGQYKMQYRFPDGTIVDAAVFVKDKIIPVDAKFSLEKYERLFNEENTEKAAQLEKELRTDIKNRINETKKYVLPQYKTTDFAMMFIPAEGVFYHCLSSSVGSMESGSVNLIEYAFSQKVVITSPVTFFAYLQTVLQALKALEIEESVKEVIKRISDLGRHLDIYNDYLVRLGNNLGKTVGSYNSAYSEFAKVDRDIVKITGKEKSVDATKVEKPGMDA